MNNGIFKTAIAGLCLCFSGWLSARPLTNDIDTYDVIWNVLPAWPKDWNVEFKLRAPKNTIVEGSYRNGKLVRLKVSPRSRLKDVQVMVHE